MFEKIVLEDFLRASIDSQFSPRTHRRIKQAIRDVLAYVETLESERAAASKRTTVTRKQHIRSADRPDKGAQ